MLLEFKIKGCDITGFELAPTVNENEKRLYELSKELTVLNPMLIFMRQVNNGKYKDMRNDDYERLQRQMKCLNYLFRDEEHPDQPAMSSMNLFFLTERLADAFAETIYSFAYKHVVT